MRTCFIAAVAIFLSLLQQTGSASATPSTITYSIVQTLFGGEQGAEPAGVHIEWGACAEGPSCNSADPGNYLFASVGLIQPSAQSQTFSIDALSDPNFGVVTNIITHDPFVYDMRFCFSADCSTGSEGQGGSLNPIFDPKADITSIQMTIGAFQFVPVQIAGQTNYDFESTDPSDVYFPFPTVRFDFNAVRPADYGIPEPSNLAVLAFVGVILWLFRRREIRSSACHSIKTA